MNKKYLFLIALFFVLGQLKSIAQNQNDSCIHAINLCANDEILASTYSATTDATDPILNCGDGVVNNSVWFKFTAISNGPISINLINVVAPGLACEVYTGSCGAFTAVPGACNAGAVDFSVTFNVVAGTTYYIMVDGEFGNEQYFDISATGTTIIAVPDANFTANPTHGCEPITVNLHNTTNLNGGTGITYNWSFDGGPNINWSTADTSVTFVTIGVHTISLTVCNAECGCKTVIQNITVQHVVPNFTYTPYPSCLSELVTFTGSASLLPPYNNNTNASVTSWKWYFDDTLSGASDSAVGQVAGHRFVGSATDTCFNVRLVVHGACGLDTVFHQLCFRPKPIVNAGPDKVICDSAVVTLTATASNVSNPVTFHWTGTGGTITSPNNATTTVTGLTDAGSPYRFIVTVTDAIGCSSKDTVYVTVHPKPRVHAIPDTMVCPYSPVQLHAVVDSGVAPFTYHWSPAGGLSSTTIANPIAIVSSTTTFCVRINDSLNCPSSDGNCVSVSIFPKPTISSSPTKHCVSDTNMTAVITVNGAGSGGGVTFGWRTSSNFSLITGSNLDSSSVTVTLPAIIGRYSFTAIVHDGNGCIDTLTISDSVIAGLPMILSPNDTICEGQSATLHASGASTYSWYSSPIDPTLTGQNTLANPVVSPTVNTTYFVVGTGLTGCTKLDSIKIFVHPKPNAVAAPLDSACGCTTVNLNGTGSTTGMGYHWISLHGSVIANPNILITTAVACVTDTFLLVTTDPSTQCRDTARITIKINPKPLVVIAPIAYVCGCSDINLNGTGSSLGMIYLWVSKHGNTITNPDSLHTVSHICATDTFTLIITNPITLCVDSAHVIGVVDIVPTAVAAPLDSVCGCTTVILNGTGSTAGMNYHWTSAHGNIITNQNNLVTTAVACVSDTFSLIVSNQSTGCRDTVQVYVKVNPKPTVIAASISQVCGCTNVNLNGTGSSMGMIYLWVSKNHNTVTNPDSLNATSLACVSDTFTLIVTNPITLCVDSTHVTVLVNSVPTVVASPIAPVCGCTTVNLNGTGSTLGLNYHWTSANGSTITNSNILVTTAYACVSDVFKLVVTNQTSGCIDSISVAVAVNPKPNAVIGITPDTICHGTMSNVSLNGTGSDSNIGTTYTWSANPRAILIFDSTALTTTAVINTTTTFTLKVMNIFGCDSIVTKTVYIFPSPTITNSHNSFCSTDSVPWNTTISVNGARAGTTYHWFVVGCASPNTSILQSQTFDLSGCGVGTTNFQIITVDGVTGCYDTLNTSVIISSGVTLHASHDTTICFGDSLKLNVNGAANFLWSNGATTSQILASPPLSVGNHTFWVKGSTGGCSSTDTIHVQVSTVPSTPAITGLISVCVNTNGVVYTVGATDPGANYVWTVPANGTIVSGQGSSSITVNWGAAGTGNITVIETIGSCTGTSRTLNVTVNAIPVTSPITGPINVCSGASGSYSVTNHVGSTYNWIITNGTQQTGGNSNSIIIQWGISGTGTIKVVETNAGCSGDTVTLTVTIRALPITSPINGSTTVCANSTNEIYDVINTLGSTYAWVIVGGIQTSGGTSNNITVTWGAAGTGSVTVTETNSFGCTGSSQTINVIIKPQPTASITTPSNNTVVCVGDLVQLTGVAPVGTVFWTTSGNGTFSNPTILNPTYTVGAGDAPTVTLTMTATNSPCPNATATVTLIVHPLPATSSIFGSDSVCVGTIGAIDSVAHHAGSTYLWIINNGTITSGQGTNVITTNWNTVGNASIKVVETSSFGCHGDTMLLNITVNPLPITSVINGPDTVCENSNGILYFVNNTNGSTYHWTTTAGATLVSGQGTNSIVINFTTVNDTITVQETNSKGCMSSISTLFIKVNTTPTATATGPGEICQGGTIPLNGTAGSGTISWTHNGTGSFSNSTIASPSYTPGANDTGHVTLTMTVSNPPCADAIAVVNVIIHPTPIVAIIASANPMCWGDTTTLTATGGGSYFWSTSSNAASIRVHPLNDTYYYITVTSSYGCVGKDSINLRVNQPGYDSAGLDVIACKGDLIHLNGKVYGAATGGIWTTTGSGTFSPNATTPNAVYTPSNSDTAAGTVKLIFTPTGACKNFPDTIIVTLESVPTVYAGPDQTVIVGNPVQLAGSGNFATNYIWTSLTGNTAFTPNDSTLNATYSANATDIKNRTVTFVLTSKGGCRVVTDTMVITIFPGIFPNVITPYPKSPGQNDYFVIEGLPTGSSLVIFNRWGEKVYETNNYQNNWDAFGLNDGTYYYVLDMHGKGVKGYITVIRD